MPETDLPQEPEAPAPFEIGEESGGAPARLRWIDPIGVGALLLGGAALLCASVSLLCVLVLPLTALTLLTGLVAVVRAMVSGKVRLIFPVAGAAVGGVSLLVAWLLPSVLGPIYQTYRQTDTLDPTAIRVIPLPGHSPAGATEGPDWVNASKAALQQGRLRVQVVSASVETRDTPKKKGPTEKYLLLRVRAHQVDSTREFAAEPLRWPGRRNEKISPTLTDNTGKVYREREVPGAGESVGTSSIFPVAVVDELFAFEPPPPGLEHLRLEVPAAIWGGTGTFRFTIPNSMIR
jgi:hypothetical protein